MDKKQRVIPHYGPILRDATSQRRAKPQKWPFLRGETLERIESQSVVECTIFYIFVKTNRHMKISALTAPLPCTFPATGILRTINFSSMMAQCGSSVISHGNPKHPGLLQPQRPPVRTRPKEKSLLHPSRLV